MSDAPAPTRAEEGREIQCTTVPEWVPVYLAERERALRAEAEVARLTQERDEALCLAEGPSTLLDLARGSVSRGMELHAAEAEVARLTAAIDMNAREVASVGLPDEAKWVLAAKDQWQRRAMAAEASASALRERVATLEAALRPFAKLGTLFGPRTHESCDVLIYGPAAGAEYNLTGDHLRAARTALEAPHADT